MSRLAQADTFGSVKTFRYKRRPPGPGVERRSTGFGRGTGPDAENPPPAVGALPTSGSRGFEHTGGTSVRGGGRNKPFLGKRKTASRSFSSATTLTSSSVKLGTSSRTDTLYRECFALEGLSFHQLTISDKLTPEMLGLNGLVDAQYVKLSSTNTYFSKHVAKSVFSYYCCVLSYARLLHLARGVGNPLTADEIAFVDYVNGSSLLVPEPLKLYLAAFGDTTLSSGTKLKFRLAARQYVEASGMPGFFGRVGPDTHYLYGGYPCLAVSASRILADVARAPDADPGWDLPEAIRPLAGEGEDFGLPTVNMVGYAPASVLTSSQRSWITNLGINDRFPSVNGSIPLCPQLLEAVSVSLGESRAFIFSPVDRGDPHGSQTQATRVQINSNTLVPAQTSFLNCNVSLLSPDRHDTNVACAGILFCLRALRATLRTQAGTAVNNWCVYSCRDYEQVPDEWVATANSLGSVDNPFLNLMMFETNQTSRVRYLQEWMDRMAAEAAAH